MENYQVFLFTGVILCIGYLIYNYKDDKRVIKFLSEPEVNNTQRNNSLKRNQIEEKFEESRKKYDEADAAFKKGNRKMGHFLMQEHKTLLKEAKDLNQKFNQQTFQETNKQLRSDTIDLHGLYVKEALQILHDKIEEFKRLGIHSLTVITGAGNNSKDKVAKIKPEVKNYFEFNKYKYEELNSGSFKVKF